MNIFTYLSAGFLLVAGILFLILRKKSKATKSQVINRSMENVYVLEKIVIGKHGPYVVFRNFYSLATPQNPIPDPTVYITMTVPSSWIHQTANQWFDYIEGVFVRLGSTWKLDNIYETPGGFRATSAKRFYVEHLAPSSNE